MSKRVIEHEVKLETSVKIILAVLAFGVLAHAFTPAFGVKDALAEALEGKLSINLTGPVNIKGKLDLGGTVTCKGCLAATGRKKLIRR